MHVTITYPEAEAEKHILHLNRDEARAAGSGTPAAPIVEQQVVFQARNDVLDLYMTEELERYLIEIVLATRNPEVYGSDLKDWLAYGASPRADAGARPLRAGPRLAQRTKLRRPRKHSSHRTRCPAPPLDLELRSSGRRDHGGPFDRRIDGPHRGTLSARSGRRR